MLDTILIKLENGTLVTPVLIMCQLREDLIHFMASTMSLFKLNARLFKSTLGPAYSEFGYYEHSAITSRFFSLKRTLLIYINARKVWI